MGKALAWTDMESVTCVAWCGALVYKHRECDVCCAVGRTLV